MTCERVKDSMDQAINKELSGAELILFRNHLNACESCRMELKKALDIYQRINLNRFELIMPQKAVNKPAIKKSVQMTTLFRKSRMYLAAALLLIASVFLYRYMRQPPQNTQSLTELLRNEDWVILKGLADNPERIRAYGSEKIPVRLILSTLTRFQQSSSLKVNGFTVSTVKIDIPVQDLRAILEQALQTGWSNKVISADRLQSYLKGKKGT